MGLDADGIAAAARRRLDEPGVTRVPSDRFDQVPRLLIERRDHGVLLITLSNPGKLNATDAAMHAELSTIFADIHASPEVRAVVVTGEGTAFSAGGDLDWIAEQVGNYEQTMKVMREAGDIVRTMIECDTPIISAINGVAVGAGLAVALLADISIIDEDARFTDGHLRSVSPPVTTPWRSGRCCVAWPRPSTTC